MAVYASLNERLAQAGICAAIFTVVSAGSSQIASGDVGPRLLALVSVGLSIWMKVQILCGAWDVGKYRKRCGNKLFQIYWGGSTAVIAIWAIGFVIAGRWDIIPTLIAAGLLPLIYFVLAGVPAALFAK